MPGQICRTFGKRRFSTAGISEDRGSLHAERSVTLMTSIQIHRQPVIALEAGILIGLLQHAVTNDKHVELVAHEAAEGVFRRAYDRFAANVEAGVDQDGAAGQSLKPVKQFVE